MRVNLHRDGTLCACAMVKKTAFYAEPQDICPPFCRSHPRPAPLRQQRESTDTAPYYHTRSDLKPKYTLHTQLPSPHQICHHSTYSLSCTREKNLWLSQPSTHTRRYVAPRSICHIANIVTVNRPGLLTNALHATPPTHLQTNLLHSTRSIRSQCPERQQRGGQIQRWQIHGQPQ